MPSRAPSDDARVALAAASCLLLAQAAASLTGGPAAEAPRLPRHVVDLGSAPVGEIEALPGVGPVLAARIVAARDRAPFASLEDLARVPGVGAATIERLRPLAHCGPR
jgi:DNA uptake protein ComE-like DNA-binding protein